MHKLTSSLLLFAAISSPVAAQGCFDFNIGPSLNLTDDSTAQGLALGFTFNYGGVGYTDICVCSNGYIWLGATSLTGGDFSPTVAELLSGAPRICPAWNDFNPSALGSGNVHYNTTPAGPGVPARAIVTWSNVYEFGTTNPVQMQVVLDDTGTVKVTYGSNPIVGGSLSTTPPATIIGASVGGGATANPISLAVRPVGTLGATWHEDFPQLGFPYAATSMLWIPTPPAGYQVVDAGCTPNNLPGPARFDVFGVGCPTPSGLGLNAGDDTTHPVVLPFAFPHAAGPFTDIVVSSNGFLTLGTTNAGSGCCNGSAAALLSGPARVAGFWQDLNASNTSTSGNGEVYTHLDPVTGDFIVTWDSLGEFGVTPPASNTFQIALSPTGDIKLRYGSVAVATHTALSGYSDGNGAVDPGVSDLSTLAPGAPLNTVYELFDSATNPVDLSGLNFLLLAGGGGYTVIAGAGGAFVPPPAPIVPPSLVNSAGSLPILGTSQLIDVGNLPASAFACINAISLLEAVPPIDMASLGAPGCTSYINFLAGSPLLQFAITGGAPTANFSLAIPNNASFAGIALVSQAIVPDPAQNALGFRFSNAGRMTVGL